MQKVKKIQITTHSRLVAVERKEDRMEMMLKLIAVIAATVIVIALMLIGLPILKKSDDELTSNKARQLNLDKQH